MFAFVFPDQFSYALGMGKELAEAYKSVFKIFKEANSLLDEPISEICFSGPEDELKRTVNAQPAVFVASYAIYSLLKQKGLKPEIVAGYGLGEFNALVAAEVLNFRDGLLLVKKRAQLMEEASQKFPGVMLKATGGNTYNITRTINSWRKKGVISVASFNCPGEVVISAEKPFVDEAIELLELAGAKEITRLPASGGFYSLLMKEAQIKFEIFLNKFNFQDGKIPLVCNANAISFQNSEAIKESMVKQLISPVRWEESLRTMFEAGVDTFIEVGPGKSLQEMIEATIHEAILYNVEDKASLEKTLSKIV